MKKILLPICAFMAVHLSNAQVVIDYQSQVDEINENPAIGQPRLGEEMEFDWYYKRRTGLEVGTAVVSYQGTNFYCTPGQTNYDTLNKDGFWGEIGQRIQFKGDARCMGVYIIYQNYDRQEGGDNYDITFYKTSGGMPTEVPYSNKVFSGDGIKTGPDKDSFTYVAFNSGDPTSVTKDFVIGLAIQEVTEFGDKLDEVTVYTNRPGDGKGEKNAMVKITQKSLLASKIPFGQTELWIPLDEVFKDNQGKFFEFDVDFMIIPVMDVTSISDGRIEMENATYKGHFPNPATDVFNIVLNVQEPIENVQVEILSLTGQKLSVQNFGSYQQGEQKIPVDATMLESGTYLYTLTVDNSSVTSQIIIE